MILALALMTAAAPAAAAPELRMAVIDLRRAVTETDEGRQVTADLKKIFETKQKELDERQNELTRSIADLDKKRTLLSVDLIRQKETELQGKAQSLRQLFERQQQEFTRKQNELLEGLLTRVQRIVATLADAESLSLVLDRSQMSAVVFARPHLDITNDVIRRLNAGEARPAKKGR
jgi:outer membrane protein